MFTYAKIYVKNIGESNSELNWTISSYPDWGLWTFTPSSETDLTPEDGITTIEVTIVAPENKQEFSGIVKIVNINNSEDFCNLHVRLSTLRNKIFANTLFIRFLERLPILQKILLLLR